MLLISSISQGQSHDSEVYKFALEKYISLNKTDSNIDTIYIRNDLGLSNNIPLIIGSTHIKLLEKENLSSNFIVLLPIESKANKKRVSLIEYSIYPEDNYIGYMGGYCFVIKIKKHDNKILLCRIEKINY